MSLDAIAVGLNAVSNCSRVDVTEAMMMFALRTGDGPGGVVRALFGDCSLETLERLSAAAGMSRWDLQTSYQTAKAIHAAVNTELEDALDRGADG